MSELIYQKVVIGVSKKRLFCLADYMHASNLRGVQEMLIDRIVLGDSVRSVRVI